MKQDGVLPVTAVNEQGARGGFELSFVATQQTDCLERGRVCARQSSKYGLDIGCRKRAKEVLMQRSNTHADPCVMNRNRVVRLAPASLEGLAAVGIEPTEVRRLRGRPVARANTTTSLWSTTGAHVLATCSRGRMSASARSEERQCKRPIKAQSCDWLSAAADGSVAKRMCPLRRPEPPTLWRPREVLDGNATAHIICMIIPVKDPKVKSPVSPGER